MAELKFEVPEGTVEGLFSEPSGEGFRVLVEAVAQALINSQAEAHFGAPWNARGMERPNGYRNGYKSRGFQTVAGALDLSIPQARSGGFRPSLFDRWQRSERALLAACGEMVLAGVSNRNVSRLAESVVIDRVGREIGLGNDGGLAASGVPPLQIPAGLRRGARARSFSWMGLGPGAPPGAPAPLPAAAPRNPS
ncbi:transposase [Mesoterricola sediminis]|uniref:Mutator family transposase n=1 Tax=Mesoterricola sediminis TaxID=2927980 RepID=A0AA48GWF9_9BACT|nr:transposase [Mesoterricola sediminis]BDU75347.1 hypothetical protein METESE_03050 [Mesoterricola sediminis]